MNIQCNHAELAALLTYFSRPLNKKRNHASRDLASEVAGLNDVEQVVMELQRWRGSVRK